MNIRKRFMEAFAQGVRTLWGNQLQSPPDLLAWPVFDVSSLHALIDRDLKSGEHHLDLDGVKVHLPFPRIIVVDGTPGEPGTEGLLWAATVEEVGVDDDSFSRALSTYFVNAVRYLRVVNMLLVTGDIVVVQGVSYMGIDANDEFIPARLGTGTSMDYVVMTLSVEGTEGLNPEIRKRLIESIQGDISIAAAGIIFMVALLNCKNVHVSAEPCSDKLRKRHIERHGHPPYRYHTLNIDVVRKTIVGESASGKIGLGKAMHICKGHFKTYTPDKPLLGKVVGKFWWQPHLRGDHKLGVVGKDYRYVNGEK
jgi:hypothetical protein